MPQNQVAKPKSRDAFLGFLREAVDAREQWVREEPIPFDVDDLYFIYMMIRRSACVAVQEYGSGWSTLAVALGIAENEQSWGDEYRALVRHPNPFQVQTVDASGSWQQVAMQRIPVALHRYVRPVVSKVSLDDSFGAIASQFENVPAFAADLVYLDGPDPAQVTGEIRGFTSTPVHSLPMSADLLRLEPHLWPETIVVTDGRTANARFLSARFKRRWQVLHDPFGDRTVMRLDETPFGHVSAKHVEVRMMHARALRARESLGS